MILDRVQLFKSHNDGNHLQERQEDCLLCTSRHMINPSDVEILEVYTNVKDLLLCPTTEKFSTFVSYAYQLMSNLDVSLREKVFDEVLHGRKT